MECLKSSASQTLWKQFWLRYLIKGQKNPKDVTARDIWRKKYIPLHIYYLKKTSQRKKKNKSILSQPGYSKIMEVEGSKFLFYWGGWFLDIKSPNWNLKKKKKDGNETVKYSKLKILKIKWDGKNRSK